MLYTIPTSSIFYVLITIVIFLSATFFFTIRISALFSILISKAFDVVILNVSDAFGTVASFISSSAHIYIDFSSITTPSLLLWFGW